MRGFAVVVLIIIGGILSVPGTIGLWVEREIVDEDNFVGTVNEAFEDEAVRTVLAERLTDAVMERLEIRRRIGDGLADIQSQRREDAPGDLVLLEGPLTLAARNVIFEVSFRVVDSELVAEVRDVSLRAVHRVVTAIVNNDKELLGTVGDTLVLDLRPLLEEIVREIGGDKGEELLGNLENLDIPEDRGVIVLATKSDLEPVWTIVQVFDRGNPWLAIAAGVLLAVAIAIARSRRRAVIGVGITVAVVAALEALAVAQPLREVAVDGLSATESGRTAAKVTYDTLVRNFLRQQVIVMLIGVGMVAGGSLAMDTGLPKAIRSAYRGQADDLAEWIRERAWALRIAGLGLGGLLLITWPDPSSRMIVTVFVLLALYLAVLTIVTSDAAWAVGMRSRGGELWERYFRVDEATVAGPTGKRTLPGWVAARAAWFRVIGIATGIIFLAAWPSVTFGLVVVIVALEFLYLAAIDMIVNRESG